VKQRDKFIADLKIENAKLRTENLKLFELDDHKKRLQEALSDKLANETGLKFCQK
jgi:hypothetical protein